MKTVTIFDKHPSAPLIKKAYCQALADPYFSGHHFDVQVAIGDELPKPFMSTNIGPELRERVRLLLEFAKENALKLKPCAWVYEECIYEDDALGFPNFDRLDRVDFCVMGDGPRVTFKTRREANREVEARILAQDAPLLPPAPARVKGPFRVT